MGELYDAAKRLREEHRMCHHANQRMHDDEGFVRVYVDFTTDLELKDADLAALLRSQPVLKPSMHPGLSDHQAARKALAAKMHVYVSYKQKGMPVRVSAWT